MSKNKIFQYIIEESDQKIVDAQKDGIQYITKKSFNNAVDEGLEYRIIGRTILKKGKNEDDWRDLLQEGDTSYLIDHYKYRMIKGYIPVGNGRYLEYAGLWIPAIFILAILIAVAFIALFSFLGHDSKDDSAFVPKDEIEELSSVEEDIDTGLTLTLGIPEGDGYYDGTVYDHDTEQALLNETDNDKKEDILSKGTLYSGSTHLKISMMVDGEEHTLADYDTDLSDGAIPDFTIDFTILDFELIEGSYDGTVCITYDDGEEVTTSIDILIRQDYSGSMSISYSPDVNIDLSSGQITCSYAPDSEDTHDTKVQLILVQDEEEYVLSESDVIEPGEKLTGMTLDPEMESRLSAGSYDGIMRLEFSAGTDSGAATSINTDMAVTINVE